MIIIKNIIYRNLLYHLGSKKQLSFVSLATTLQAIETESSNINKYNQLQDLISQNNHDSNSTKQIISFCLNEPSIIKKTNRFFVPENVLLQSLATISGIPLQSIKKDLRRYYDLSDYAQEIFSKRITNTNQMSLSDLFVELDCMQQFQGFGSEELKLNKLVGILQQCSDPLEVKFIFRFFMKKLRIGLSTKSIEKILLSISPIFQGMQRDMLGYTLDHNFQVGTPIQPMLADLSEDPYQIACEFLRGQVGFCEFKYDGERIQVHFSNGVVQLFNRTLDDRTWRYPLLAQNVEQYLKLCQIENAILDCEMICYDNKGKILAFQEMQNLKCVSTEIQLICFDLLFINDISLIQSSLSERQKIYTQYINKEPHNAIIKLVQSTRVSDGATIQQKFNEAMSLGLEGVMVKRDCEYKPGKRTDWCKLKSHKDVDLALLGGFWGKGKRTSILGAYLLGALNSQDGKIYPITKIGTGLSNQFMADSTARMDFMTEIPHQVQYQRAVKPDVWVQPNEVWEVRYESITVSPKYQIQMQGNNFVGGISLRFPRFMRVRHDKSLQQITTTEQIINQYHQQNLRFRSL